MACCSFNVRICSSMLQLQGTSACYSYTERLLCLSLTSREQILLELRSQLLPRHSHCSCHHPTATVAVTTPLPPLRSPPHSRSSCLSPSLLHCSRLVALEDLERANETLCLHRALLCRLDPLGPGGSPLEVEVPQGGRLRAAQRQLKVRAPRLREIAGGYVPRSAGTAGRSELR